ncbi:transcription factor Tfb2 [Sporormia fimetaria CBS 119925]|uniref:RNA polymerase II transcription factor B subunit 2 n=1 Tax=Sporormia fimetaria CBS 119925 TaxID=1340428 RepID=A0A6A6VEG2_9PLEO|nr:transcription factor Tfb2 [Sporormia fimetaria CBS 119925]
MLYMPGPFMSAHLDAWFKPEARREKDKALFVLEQLHILIHKVDANRQTSYVLYESFRRSLRQALEGSGTARSFGIRPSQPNSKRVDIAFLDDYARKQWDTLLFYMVGNTVGLKGGDMGSDISDDTIGLLKLGNLVQSSYGRTTITQAGFNFVLQATSAQVWSLLIVYLKHAESHLGLSETEILSFLFMLGFLELGEDYSTAALTRTQLTTLDILCDLGIAYRPSKSSTSFYPTRLAVSLVSDSASLPASGHSNPTGGYIIVETNHRVYAYTTSLLQIAVLSLFTRLTTRFPNLVSGKITRQSVQKAIKLGISSQQIISYLTAHAHPQMRKTQPFLPPTVIDQIRLWEFDRERVEVTQGYLMKEFNTESEYRDTAAYAESLGVLVWRNDMKKVFFVDRIEQMTTYLERRNRGH